MAELAAGVTILTARHLDGTPRGLLVTSLCSYSIEPPSVLACIQRSRGSHGPLVRCGEFGVHLLGREQIEVAREFAAPGHAKFERVAWRWDDDVPALADVLVYLRCQRMAVFDYGDHSIVIGNVVDGSRTLREPLVYLRRRIDWSLRSVPVGPGHDHGMAGATST